MSWWGSVPTRPRGFVCACGATSTSDEPNRPKGGGSGSKPREDRVWSHTRSPRRMPPFSPSLSLPVGRTRWRTPGDTRRDDPGGGSRPRTGRGRRRPRVRGRGRKGRTKDVRFEPEGSAPHPDRDPGGGWIDPRVGGTHQSNRREWMPEEKKRMWTTTA